MRVRIHRGAREVGGSCVEVLSQGWRIVLDVGLPLDASVDATEELPCVRGLSTPCGKTAVFVTHGHPDHHGLAPLVHQDVPLFMGEAAQRILAEAAFFTGAEAPRTPTTPLRPERPICFGPFTVTPLLADHSAFDAYSLLVDADGRRLFYSGDLRGHGRKRRLFDGLIADPPRHIDALLLEGTHVRPDGNAAAGPSELEVEDRCAALFEETPGMVLACYSPQNVDRLVTLYRAARRAGREFVMDLYAATVAAATRNPRIPQAGWRGVRVYLPRSQRRRIISSGEFERASVERVRRIYPGALRERAGELVMTFRQSMTHELERADCLHGAACLWSLWAGYLERESGDELPRWLDTRAIPLSLVHASGHAAVADLQRLAAAVGAQRMVPIHTGAPERFTEVFRNVELHPDGEWWEV